MHRILIIGGGSIGERHVRCFLGTGRAAVSVCEPRDEQRAFLERSYDLTAAYPDFEGIDLSAFDAGVICVPAHLHIPCARRMAEAGMHILTEKPLSLTRDGIDDLARVVQDKGLTFAVGYVKRARRVYSEARKAADSGAIGQIRSAVFIAGYDHRVARPDYRNTYFARAEAGGGVVFDLLSHNIDLIQWMMGPAERVTAMYDHLVIEDTNVEDTASLLLRIGGVSGADWGGGGGIATLHMNAWEAHRTEALTLSGTEGSIIADSIAGRVGVYCRETGEWAWREGLSEPRDEKGQMDGPFVRQADNFLDAIEGKAEPICSLAEAHSTMEVCLAALESGRAGRSIEIPSLDAPFDRC